MQFTTVFLSFCLQALLVTAQESEPECILNNSGPDSATKQAALDAFIQAHTGDGVLRIGSYSEGPCIRCGNAEISSNNICAGTREASPDSIRELFGEFVEGGDGCGGPLNTAEGAEAGCMAMIYGSLDYWDDNCQTYC